MSRPEAISIDEALKTTSQEAEDIICRSILTINKRLAYFVAGTYRVVYADSDLGLRDVDSDMKKFILKELVEVYLAKGWSVRLEYGDQREPDTYLQFYKG